MTRIRCHEKSETRFLTGLFFPKHVLIWPPALVHSSQEGEDGQGQDKDGCVLVIGHRWGNLGSAVFPSLGRVSTGMLGLCFCHKPCEIRVTAIGVRKE